MAKKKKLHRHLLRGVPNTQANRDYWHGISKQMGRSDSMWTLRLKGRTPDLKKIMAHYNCTEEEAKINAKRMTKYGSVGLHIAKTFAVYANLRDGAKKLERDSRQQSYEWGFKHGERKARVKIEYLEQQILREQQDDTDWKLVAEQRAETINELMITYVATLEQREEEIVALKAELVDFESGKLRAEPILEGEGITLTLNINLDTAKDREVAMPKTYNLWIVIEKFDRDEGNYQDLCENGEADPIRMGAFDTYEETVDAAQTLEHHFNNDMVEESKAS